MNEAGINLLPDDDLLGRPGGKFLVWALSWGKKIVIITELVVVLAFISRFWLDTSIANFSEEIDKKKTIILASSEFEQKFVDVQKRLNEVKKITRVPSATTVMDRTRQVMPQTITLVQMSVNGSSISLAGLGQDADLAKMVIAFKEAPDFTDVTMDRVAKEQAALTGVNFTLAAKYKP